MVQYRDLIHATSSFDDCEICWIPDGFGRLCSILFPALTVSLLVMRLVCTNSKDNVRLLNEYVVRFSMILRRIRWTSTRAVNTGIENARHRVLPARMPTV
jgi:hypothetical protein